MQDKARAPWKSYFAEELACLASERAGRLSRGLGLGCSTTSIALQYNGLPGTERRRLPSKTSQLLPPCRDEAMYPSPRELTAIPSDDSHGEHHPTSPPPPLLAPEPIF